MTLPEHIFESFKANVSTQLSLDQTVALARQFMGSEEKEALAAFANPCSLWIPADGLRGIERGRRYGNYNWIRIETKTGPIAVYQEPAHNDGIVDAMHNGWALFGSGVWRQDLEDWVRDKLGPLPGDGADDG